MTTYAKDFSDELTTGVFASDFTSRFATTSDWTVEATADAEDNRAFQSDGTGSGVQLVSWDDVDGDANRDNCEIVARFRVSSDSQQVWGLWARASGSTSSETGYLCEVQANAGRIDVMKYVSGTLTTEVVGLDADSGMIPWAQSEGDLTTWDETLPNKWLYVRFRVNGTGATVTLQAKAWIDGVIPQNEPSFWHTDGTDTDGDRITAAGWIGLGRRTHSSITTEYDYISVGTNGDTAPINASTNTTVRLTQVAVEVIGQEANPSIQVSQVWASAIGRDSAPTVRLSNTSMQVLHKRVISSGVDVSGQLIITTG